MAFCWRYGLAAGKQACFELGASPLPLSLIWRRREKTSILRVLLSFLLDFMRPKLSKRKDLALCHWLRGNCGEINYWKCRALKLPNGRGDLVQSPEHHPPQGYRVAPLCPVPSHDRAHALPHLPATVVIAKIQTGIHCGWIEIFMG